MNLDDFYDLKKLDLFEKFKAQVERDFELSGAKEAVPKLDTNDLSYIYKEVFKSVCHLEKKDSTSLMNLLYRIDISESQIKKMNQAEPKKSLEEILTIAIIKRILQKVIYKHYYS